MKKYAIGAGTALLATVLFISPESAKAEETSDVGQHSHKVSEAKERELPERMLRFRYESGYTFEYPDAVRGTFVTGHSAGGSKFNELIELTNETELNAMVIDVKDDHGHLTFRPNEDSPYMDISQEWINDPEEMMATLEEHEIYPIARVVVFKDTVLAEERPEWSFTQDGEVWKNNRGEAFVNPFVEEVWDYNIDIAEKAAQLGFQEIQFDYVRFPEGFENRYDVLDYDHGNYADSDDDVEARVDAVSDFVAHARERLGGAYDVDVSVDVFGYAFTVENAPGIGQNIVKISENVDVISSMIYPSHWTPHFGLDKPDLYPYELTDAYAQVENEVLGQLDDPPVSRPWIQDFTASYLGAGNYIPYGVEEVEAQIRALNENGIDEFLLWNASNNYTEGVDYTPLD
ncbi:putative glycoside hydrolase [Thalassorhabdus alkalitolerans]|uniref:Glycoside hydrolase n=1 Tax=Thalassorhabdus alkalitolerans TaxID=2282697 RepID=A0ABW0YK51_9BACI|nr:putative glycoside hydrolase [Thalassobacillus sp. C254]